MQQPMAMAQVLVGKAALLGAKQERNRSGSQALANEASAVIQPPQRMLQPTVAPRGSPDYQRAVGHCFADARVFFRAAQQLGSAHGGAGLAKRRFIGIHHAQVAKPEVAHGAGSSADVERIARGYQDNTQAILLGKNRQACLFYDMHLRLGFLRRSLGHCPLHALVQGLLRGGVLFTRDGAPNLFFLQAEQFFLYGFQ